MRITQMQKEKLKELIGSNPQLRRGKFTASFTRKDATREWELIASILNSIPGAKKDWKSWRKCWQDIQSKTKSKKAAVNRALRGTGGGPPPTPLNEFEEGVAALLHQHAISGHNNSESAVEFEDTVHTSNWVVDVPLPFLSRTPTPVQSPENCTGEISPPPEFASNSLPEPALQSQKSNVKKNTKLHMKTLLKEKLEIKKQALEEKKKIYSAFLEIFDRTSKALEDIGNAVSKK